MMVSETKCQIWHKLFLNAILYLLFDYFIYLIIRYHLPMADNFDNFDSWAKTTVIFHGHRWDQDNFWSRRFSRSLARLASNPDRSTDFENFITSFANFEVILKKCHNDESSKYAFDYKSPNIKCEIKLNTTQLKLEMSHILQIGSDYLI